MPSRDVNISRAIATGRRHAVQVLRSRERALKTRETALNRNPKRIELQIEPVSIAASRVVQKTLFRTSGFLIAEGDSWFDYPWVDVLKLLKDHYGYTVKSVAHRGDAVEQMAYGGDQLEEFLRKIEELIDQGLTPRAILLSGGGNDIAGREFSMLLNHIASPVQGLSDRVLQGVIDERTKYAYVTILSSVTDLCRKKLKKSIPIVLHGYDYPVPDGRGYLTGKWILPGPWLDPGFREKGFRDLARRKELARVLIDRFNHMLLEVSRLGAFSHVHYIDLRGTLSSGADYKQWWDNELHPTRKGFASVTKRFADVLQELP